MPADLPKPPARPCGSCPYRRDVPSGVWHREEYEKLEQYDGDIGEQIVKEAFGLFMCHQRDGCLCGGWLQTHDPCELIALRLHRNVDPSVWDYRSDVETFSSGAEAAAHGLRDIENPGPEARALMRKLGRLPIRRRA